jgi:hypothetical protein
MRMLVGEAGPELVSVTPKHKLGSSSDGTRNVNTMMMASSYDIGNNAIFSGYSEEDRKEMIQWAREMREPMYLFRSPFAFAHHG